MVRNPTKNDVFKSLLPCTSTVYMHTTKSRWKIIASCWTTQEIQSFQGPKLVIYQQKQAYLHIDRSLHRLCSLELRKNLSAEFQQVGKQKRNPTQSRIHITTENVSVETYNELESLMPMLWRKYKYMIITYTLLKYSKHLTFDSFIREYICI